MPTTNLLLAALFITFSVASHADVSVSSEDGLLTVQAENATASELAEKLSEQLGISVVVTGNAETRVNLDIVDEPLEKALGKLSPNNLLVHNTQATEIIEIVLMMGEENGSGGGNSEEFLPSGSPAEEVIVEQPFAEQALDESEGGILRDPSRSLQVRNAAEAASEDPNLPASQVPPMYAEDAQIDPATGLPYNEQ